MRGCDFIFEFGPFADAKRFARWCDAKKRDNKRSECIKSCHVCGAGKPISPTPPSPTPPSPTPPTSPSPPSSCKDTNHEWETWNGDIRGCDFILAGGSNADKRRVARWCDKKKRDNKRAQCPRTCGACDEIDDSNDGNDGNDSDDSDDMPHQDLMDIMLKAVNDDRKKEGVNPLCYNDKLNQAALKHSNDMRKNKFFSHTGSDGSAPSLRSSREKYNYRSTGENIATQWDILEIHDMLMNSSGHRRNILYGGYDHIGIGITYYEEGTGYRFAGNMIVTQVFGSSLTETCSN